MTAIKGLKIPWLLKPRVLTVHTADLVDSYFSIMFLPCWALPELQGNEAVITPQTEAKLNERMPGNG